MGTGTIYGLINSNTLELRYIGLTKRTLSARFAQHGKGKGLNVYMYRWLRSVPVTIIMLEREPLDINEAEIRWIREMREKGARLLNMTDGGEGGGGMTGRKHSIETRTKMSLSAMGNHNHTDSRDSLGRFRSE